MTRNNGSRDDRDPVPDMGEIVESFQMYELTPTDDPRDAGGTAARSPGR